MSEVNILEANKLRRDAFIALTSLSADSSHGFFDSMAISQKMLTTSPEYQEVEFAKLSKHVGMNLSAYYKGSINNGLETSLKRVRKERYSGRNVGGTYSYRMENSEVVA